MARTIISEGKTSTEAIEKGLKELKISKDNAIIKVLEEKKKSFFSILDPHVVKVEITVKDENLKEEKIEESPKAKEEIPESVIEEAVNQIKAFLDEFLKYFSDGKIKYDVHSEEGEIFIDIEGEGTAKLIGYRGDCLNALQTIISNIARNKTDKPVSVILDIEGYRNKRKKVLEELARKLEKTVIRNGKTITLEPMTPYERKIIHMTLQQSKNVKTHSIGEGSNRRLVISKK